MGRGGGGAGRTAEATLLPVSLDEEVRAATCGSLRVLPLSQLLDGRWHPVPGTGASSDVLSQLSLSPYTAALMQLQAQNVQKMDWLDMAVPAGSAAHAAGLRTGDRFVACRGGATNWGPRVWMRRENQGNSAGSVHIGVNWPEKNGAPGEDVVAVPADFAASLSAGANIYVVRCGRALRLTLPSSGGSLGVVWTKPPKSTFYR